MKAIIATARGAARDTLQFVERDQPTPRAGEVLVRLVTTGVNPSDVKVRSGAQGPMPAPEVIPHNDGAGVIEGLGDGVVGLELGMRVWLYNVNRSQDGLSQGVIGTAAEYVAVPQKFAVPLPDATSFDVGACLGVPAMTAHRAVFGAGPVEGKTVLVTGGAGSVGQLAVQMAAARGVRVIATVSREEKAAIARAAGAADVVNYLDGDLASALVELVGEHGIDHIVDVDFAAHIQLATRLLSRHGTLSAYASTSNFTPEVPFYPMAFQNSTVNFVFVYAMDDAAMSHAREDIAGFLTEGVLDPLIGEKLPLHEIAKAHELIEAGGTMGQVLLDI